MEEEPKEEVEPTTETLKEWKVPQNESVIPDPVNKKSNPHTAWTDELPSAIEISERIDKNRRERKEAEREERIAEEQEENERRNRGYEERKEKKKDEERKKEKEFYEKVRKELKDKTGILKEKLTRPEIDIVNGFINSWKTEQNPMVVVKLLGFVQGYLTDGCLKLYVTHRIMNIAEANRLAETNKDYMEITRKRLIPERPVAEHNELLNKLHNEQTLYYKGKNQSNIYASQSFSLATRILKGIGWADEVIDDSGIPTPDYDSWFKEASDVIDPPKEEPKAEEKESKQEEKEPEEKKED